MASAIKKIRVSNAAHFFRGLNHQKFGPRSAACQQHNGGSAQAAKPAQPPHMHELCIYERCFSSTSQRLLEQRFGMGMTWHAYIHIVLLHDPRETQIRSFCASMGSRLRKRNNFNMSPVATSNVSVGSSCGRGQLRTGLDASLLKIPIRLQQTFAIIQS